VRALENFHISGVAAPLSPVVSDHRIERRHGTDAVLDVAAALFGEFLDVGVKIGVPAAPPAFLLLFATNFGSSTSADADCGGGLL
jgi:hypothetical protein